MLQITIPPTEMWDEQNECFKCAPGQTLRLEHSLVSVSKWESKWRKAFLSDKEKTKEETLDYIKCMTLTQNVPPDIYDRLTDDNIAAINEYIKAPMTATVFFEDESEGGKPKRDTITAELVYYWMIAQNIPPEYEKWHLNRLITLIRVCNLKNQPPKKRNARDTMRRNAALNAKRRKQHNTRG